MPIINGQGRVGVRVPAVAGGGGGGTDADAQAFITAASITDSTQQSAINTLVVDLKAANIWTKMKAIYPMVGGTASAHKFNLKDPRDLDVAYRLVFNGGWTHSSTGALPNGSNGYADTKLNPSTSLTSFNSNHLSFYSRTNTLIDSADMGGGAGGSYITIEYGTQWNGNTWGQSTRNPSTGLFINTRTNNTTQKMYKNATLANTNTGTNTGSANANIFIGARNIGGGNQYSTRESAFATIGDGLTDAEASALYTAVQAFQTTLGRQV